MSNKYTTQDERSREAIISETKTNLFVEAGAGSGKTTMLVNRMVAMVEDGIPVEKICAITFTKNAALEFYERFQAKLIERSNPNNEKEAKRAGDLQKPTNETRAKCLKALENIDLSFMGTIDSFCNMILSEHPGEANIPSDAKLINDEEAKQIYKQFYVDIRNGKYDAYDSELRKCANRFSMLFYNPEEAFAKLTGEIMDRRNVEFHVNNNLCIDFFKCFSNVRNDMIKVLNVFNTDLSKLAIKLGTYDTREPMDVYDKAYITLSRGWQYNYTGVERALKDIASLSYSESPDVLGFTSESVVREEAGQTVLNILDEDNPDALLIKLHNYKYQNALNFVLKCIKPLEELMRKDGKFTYFDYLYYLRNMLVNDAQNGGKLISYINNRHSYFLIDEFQDTNPMQAEVFFYLAAQDPNKKTWQDCLPKPGSLFIVGDPKQSIYRFRSADVASYLNIKQLFENPNVGKVLYLVNNFRSKNVVKQYFNDVFEELMAEETGEQSKYLDIENTNSDEEKEFNGIYTYEAYSESLLGEYPEMEDCKQIAIIIKTLVNNPNTQILGEDKKLRPLTYKDFMVIFSAKDSIGPCIKELVENNIPTHVEGKVLFEECEGFNAIFSIYYAITDLNNAVPLVYALYSPVFGFNDNDLASYRKSGNSIKIDINKEYGKTPLELALAKLSASAIEASTLTPSSLYEKIMDDYEIFKYVSSENLEIVYYVLELIRGEERSGNIVNYEDAVDYMSNLLNGESDVERCLGLSQNLDAVHIANLHKVKGLEAPVVILGKAGNGAKNPNIRIEYSRTSIGTKVDGYVISVSNKESYTNLIETNEYKQQSDAEKASLTYEGDRLVYVAATRARNALIVSEGIQRSGRGGLQHAGKRNKWYALKAKATDGDIFETMGENSSYKKVNHTKVQADNLYKDIKEFSPTSNITYSLKQPSDTQTSTRVIENVYEDELSNKETSSTLLGTMVHRLLEMIIMSKDTINKEDAITNILTEYVSFDEKEDEYKHILENVYDVMHNGGFPQTNGVEQNILPVLLNNKVYSEVPFTYKDGDVIWNGYIDLVYEKDNKLHIIDWKTNKDANNLDEHYKLQLEAYKKAIKQILGLEVEDAYIYHVDISK